MNKHPQVGFGGPSFEARRAPTHRERFLAEMERAVPWGKVHALIEPVYADPRRGRPLELDRLLRIYFLQHWFRLGDAAVREALYDSRAMRSFVCIGPGSGDAPEEAAIRKFRQLLQEYGLGEAIVAAADRHLRALGIAVTRGAIVDAAAFGTSNAHPQAPFAKFIDTAAVAAG